MACGAAAVARGYGGCKSGEGALFLVEGSTRAKRAAGLAVAAGPRHQRRRAARPAPSPCLVLVAEVEMIVLAVVLVLMLVVVLVVLLLVMVLPEIEICRN